MNSHTEHLEQVTRLYSPNNGHAASPINLLLGRLDNPRKYGQGYRAACPAHEGTSRSSLSIREADDGRVLLHCFAGCGVINVVQSLGLETKDLFERSITANMTFEEKVRIRQLAKQSQWKAAIKSLPLEIRIIEFAAVDLANGRPLSEPDRQRLILASKRIRSAKVVLCDR